MSDGWLNDVNLPIFKKFFTSFEIVDSGRTNKAEILDSARVERAHRSWQSNEKANSRWLSWSLEQICMWRACDLQKIWRSNDTRRIPTRLLLSLIVLVLLEYHVFDLDGRIIAAIKTRFEQLYLSSCYLVSPASKSSFAVSRCDPKIAGQISK